MQDYFESIGGTEKLSKTQKYELALKAALAIKQLHDQDILHCDIKPENFMLDWQGDIAVVEAIDFGVSMVLLKGQTNITLTQIKGTPDFMAPEICVFERYENGQLVDPFIVLSAGRIYSKASDVYALGILFAGDLGISEELGKQDELLVSLVTRMIDVNPKERPSMDEVVSAFFLGQYITAKKELREESIGVHNILDPKIVTLDLEIATIDKLRNSLLEYFANPKSNDSRNDTIDDILFEITNHQNTSEDTTSPTDGSFYIKLLQSLPVELRDGVCNKLGIEKGSSLLIETSDTAKKELETKIRDYRQKELDSPAASTLH